MDCSDRCGDGGSDDRNAGPGADADAHGEAAAGSGYTATHAAIATRLDRETVFGMADREGWPAKYRKRGGVFGVIEMWLEGDRMIEVLTAEMQAEYLAALAPENVEALIASVRPQTA